MAYSALVNLSKADANAILGYRLTIDGCGLFDFVLKGASTNWLHRVQFDFHPADDSGMEEVKRILRSIDFRPYENLEPMPGNIKQTIGENIGGMMRDRFLDKLDAISEFDMAANGLIIEPIVVYCHGAEIRLEPTLQHSRYNDYAIVPDSTIAHLEV